MHCRELFGSGNSRLGQKFNLLNPRHPAAYRQHSSRTHRRARSTRRGSDGPWRAPGCDAPPPEHLFWSPRATLRAGTGLSLRLLLSLLTLGIFRSQLNPPHQQDNVPRNSWKHDTEALCQNNRKVPTLNQTPKQLPAEISPPRAPALPFCPKASPGSEQSPARTRCSRHQRPPERCWSLRRAGAASCPPACPQGCPRPRLHLTLQGTHYKRQTHLSRRGTGSSQRILPARGMGKWTQLEARGEATSVPAPSQEGAEGGGGLRRAHPDGPQANRCVEEECGQHCLLPAGAC